MLSVMNESACEGAAGNEDEGGGGQGAGLLPPFGSQQRYPWVPGGGPPGQRSPLCPHKPGGGAPRQAYQENSGHPAKLETQINGK